MYTWSCFPVGKSTTSKYVNWMMDAKKQMRRKTNKNNTKKKLANKLLLHVFAVVII